MRQAIEQGYTRFAIGMGVGAAMLANPLSALIAVPGMTLSGLTSGLASGSPVYGAAVGIAALPIGMAITSAARVTRTRNRFFGLMAATALSIGAITGYATQPDRPVTHNQPAPAELTQ